MCKAINQTGPEELRELHQNGNLKDHKDHTKACSVTDLRPSAKDQNGGDREGI